MATNGKVDPRTEIGRFVHWLSRRHFKYCESCLQAVGIGPGQVPILMELGRHGSLSQRELAAHVHVTAATISGTLKRLEKSGIIQRTGTEDDARVSMVSLTEAGKKRCEEAQQIFTSADSWMVSDLSAEECAQMHSMLQRMLKTVDAGLENFCEKEGEKP